MIQTYEQSVFIQPKQGAFAVLWVSTGNANLWKSIGKKAATMASFSSISFGRGKLLPWISSILVELLPWIFSIFGKLLPWIISFFGIKI